jgi:hypothetical protein
LFRDPGRASRGLSGTQEVLLGIFERNAWPIPDLVAIKDDGLLLIEIDHRIQATSASISRYREVQHELLASVNSAKITGPVSRLLLGFTKIGAIRNPVDILNSYGLEMVVSFDEPFAPAVLWNL